MARAARVMVVLIFQCGHTPRRLLCNSQPRKLLDYFFAYPMPFERLFRVCDVGLLLDDFFATHFGRLFRVSDLGLLLDDFFHICIYAYMYTCIYVYSQNMHVAIIHWSWPERRVVYVENVLVRKFREILVSCVIGSYVVDDVDDVDDVDVVDVVFYTSERL